MAGAGRRDCEVAGAAGSDCELAGAGWDLWGAGAVMGTAGRRGGWDGWPGQRRVDVSGRVTAGRSAGDFYS